MIYSEIYKDIFTMDKKFYLAHCIASDFRMGAGIAVAFKKKYSLVTPLKTYSYTRDTSPGSCVLVDNVFNLITKRRSTGKPTYLSLTKSLYKMKEIIVECDIEYLAMPKIGCGLDRLQWGKVREIINEVFKNTNIEIVICKW